MDWGNVTVEELVEALQEVDWTTPPRPISEFFAKFSVPRSIAKWDSRSKCNFYYYRTNYFILLAVILEIAFLRNPLALLAVVMAAFCIACLNDSRMDARCVGNCVQLFWDDLGLKTGEKPEITEAGYALFWSSYDGIGDKDSDLLKIPYSQIGLGRVLHRYVAQISPKQDRSCGIQPNGCQMRWELCPIVRIQFWDDLGLKTGEKPEITEAGYALFWSSYDGIGDKDSDLLKIPYSQIGLGRVLHRYVAQISPKQDRSCGIQGNCQGKGHLLGEFVKVNFGAVLLPKFSQNSFALSVSHKVTKAVRRISPQLAAKMRPPMMPVIRGRPASKRAVYICGQSRKMVVFVMAAVTCLMWFVTSAFLTVFGALAVALACIILHSSLRTPNLKARLNTFREEFRAVWRTYGEF
ncbi:hypothetical protein L7F22_040210 [Adiantum nelumboides]|nr:hypothetical protein [Adiantum nelumboides]